MDEDKRYLLIPYGLLIGLLIRMYAQKDFSGFPLFIAIMTAAICIFSTWLVFRKQEPAAPAQAQPTELPRPASEPVKEESAMPQHVPKTERKASPTSAPAFLIRDGVLVHYSGASPVVRVPHGVHTIGENAFASQPNRTREESIPPRAWDQYGADPFTGMATVTDDRIPGNRHIQRVILPEGVITIRHHAFYQCENLEEVVLPDSLQSIGHLAFGDCPKLTSIDLPQGVRLDMNPFDGCSPAILSAIAAATAPIKEAPAMAKPTTTPHRSLNLLYYALHGDKLIPAELTGSQGATLRRKALESVAALDVSCIDTTGVTGMASVFARCYCLEKLDLSTFDFSQVTDMGKMFDECGALREVIFSDTINRTCCIPRYTSSRSDDELNDLWKHEYITAGPQAADVSLDRAMDKQLVSFQEATHAERCAYLGLLKSAKITVVPHRQPAPLPDPADDAPGFLIKDDVLVYYYGKGLEVRVPKGVKYIGEKAFSSRPSPEVLEAIPPRYRAQYDEAVLNQIAPLVKGQAPGNPYIRQVILPEGVMYIRSCAFYMCAQLEKVELPESLEWIGPSAFCQCAKLTSINLPKHVELSLSPFYGSPGVYQTVREWEQTQAASKPKPAPPKSPYADVDVPEGGPTIQNSDFDIKDGVLLRYKGWGKQVVVPEGVHTIAKHAFVWSNTSTSTVSVPPMFWDQYGADSFTGQAEVTTTNHTGMSHVSSVTLPEGVVLIQDAAFYKCSGLKEINFPQSLQYIGRRAFCQCVQLPSIDLPQKVRLATGAFEGCRDEVVLAAYRHRERAKSE